MMVYVNIIFLSLLAGAAAAGFTWFAWGLLVNVGAYRQHRIETAALKQSDDELADGEGDER